MFEKSISLNFRSLFAAICGNFIEWYDFALYLLLAPILSKHFFPIADKKWALIGTFTIYAVSFFFRPIGGVLFGHIGDKYGRKIALKWSITCLTALSVVLSCVPDYSKIGIISTILLCLCRVGQGICLGGEFAGSMIYLSETAPIHRRALFSSLSNNGSNFGILIASLSCLALTTIIGENNFSEWGYRILFFMGGIIGLVGFYFRTDIQESLEYSHCANKTTAPLIAVLKYHKQALFNLFIIISIGAVGSYALMGYVSTFLQQSLSLSLTEALSYETLFISVTLLIVPLFAVLADKYTPKRLLNYTCLLYILFSIPCFYLVYYYQQPLWLLVLFIIYSIEEASIPSLMRDYFPVSIRYTGVSLSYNLSMGLIGGLSPVFTQSLLDKQFAYGIAYLLMASSIAVLLVLNLKINSIEETDLMGANN